MDAARDDGLEPKVFGVDRRTGRDGDGEGDSNVRSINGAL